MTTPGLGVMLRAMYGNEDSVAALTAALGKTFTSITLGTDDALHFVFDDGTKIKLADEGQSCCESRYMRTDDNLAEFVGTQFLGAEVKDAPPIESDAYGDHEVQFLEIKTNKGVFTVASHNEHNGYYGGFSIEASVEA